MDQLLLDKTHRRKNPLTGEWILVSPHRLNRPWQGKSEKQVKQNKPAHDEKCYLCPSNTRANGEINPNYTDTFVFTNDYAALLPKTIEENSSDDPLFTSQSASGTAKVICFSPDHSLTMGSMSPSQIKKIIDVWADEVKELSKLYEWVQVFENKGEIMGCSNPHPHGQIWASNFLPSEAEKEDNHQLQYYQLYHRNLLLDYVKREQELNERIVCENDQWLIIVPFWATWPFETLVLPKQHCAHFTYMNEQQKTKLAEILKTLLQKYDRVFDVSFPYSMGWHGAPSAKNMEHWQLHAHFYPPLLRSATIKKFMVGFEMLGESQRDVTPEQTAKILRDL